MRLRETAQRHILRLVVLDGGVHVRRLVRVDVAWGDGVDADAVGRPFGGEAFGEIGYGGFGRVVEDLVWWVSDGDEAHICAEKTRE